MVALATRCFLEQCSLLLCARSERPATVLTAKACMRCSTEQAERREIRADQRKDKEDFVAQRAEIGKLDSDAYEKVYILC
jgi:hypothetical protein